MCVYVYVSKYVCVCVCVCVCVSECIYVCICIYVYVYLRLPALLCAGRLSFLFFRRGLAGVLELLRGAPRHLLIRMRMSTYIAYIYV